MHDIDPSNDNARTARQAGKAKNEQTSAPVVQPKPPFKKQQQQPPGLESALNPAAFRSIPL